MTVNDDQTDEGHLFTRIDEVVIEGLQVKMHPFHTLGMRRPRTYMSM